MELEKKKRMKCKIDLFRPESFIVFYIIFLLLAGAGFLYWEKLARPSLFSIGFVVLSLGAFYIGVKWAEKRNAETGKGKLGEYKLFIFLATLTLLYGRVASNFFGTSTATSILISGSIIGVFFIGMKKLSEKNKVPRNLYRWLIGIGAGFLFLTFYQVGGIPLFNTALRANLDKSWAWLGAVFFFMVGYVGELLEQKDRKIVFLLIIAGTLLFVLTAFRTGVVLVLLSGAISAYKTKKLDNKTILMPLISAIVLVMLVGYFVANLANPVTLLLWRAGTTYNVYDTVLGNSIPFGVEHGNFLLGHVNSRDYLAGYFGSANSLTSTILGPALVDFGPLFALAFMLGLGYVLGDAYRAFRRNDRLLKIFYPILLAFAIVWIETGFDQYMLCVVWAYLIMKWIK